MTLEILNPANPGVSNDWGVVGASTGWEAVRKDSEDDSYIGTGTLAAQSTFFCGDGREPLCGFVSALIVWIRVRRTEASAGGSLTLLINQNGTLRTADIFTPPPASAEWFDYFAVVREDWATSLRFTDAGLITLESGVQLTTLPSAGGFEVSKLYLAVEQIDSVFYYDPYMGVTPDAVVGDRQAGTGGLEPASITGDNYLEIVDTSLTNQRTYIYGQLVGTVKQDYVTEVETRLEITALPANPTGIVAHVALIMDLDRGVTVNYFVLAGVQHLGIMDIWNDINDPASYLALIPLEFFNTSRHIRVRYDRSLNPDDKGMVQVFVDYETTPFMEIAYEAIPTPAPPPFPVIIFGSPSPRTVTEKIDYFSFKTFKRGGYSFQDYIEFDEGTNKIIADPNDSHVNSLVTLPPGIEAGQSNRSCKFIYNDPTQLCGFYTIFNDYEGATAFYDLALDYRCRSGSPAIEVMCQRCSDLFYWDQGSTLWQSAFSVQQLPSTGTARIRAFVFNGINNSSPDGLIFTVRIVFPPIPPAPYDVWLYRLHLTK